MSNIPHDAAANSQVSLNISTHGGTNEVHEDPTSSFRNLFIKVVSSERFLLIIGLTAITIDPWFFYIPIVKGGSTCLGLDKMLMIAVVILRTLVDILHDWSWWHKSRRPETQHSGYDKGPMTKDISYSLLRRSSGSVEIPSPGQTSGVPHHIVDWFKQFKNCQISSPKGRSSTLSRAIAIIASLPLPQMVVLAIDLQSRFKMCLKVVVLGQLAPRIFRTYPTFVATTTNSDIHSWIGAGFNFLLYTYASHALGGLWYIRAVDRQMICMQEACRGRPGCIKSSLYCENGNYGNNGFIKDICTAQPTSTVTKPFDYGIYIDAIKSNLIGSTNIVTKLIDGFWWGLRNLSTMAQSFELNDQIWDTLFAILICILGLILFALLIGNLQMYLQSKMPLTVEKMKERREELRKWPLYSRLSNDLKNEIITCQHSSWEKVSEVNLESLLNNISSELGMKIKSRFCNNFQKVEEFEKLSKEIKEKLLERAKPIVFQARTKIQEKGYPIYEMIYIVHGKVVAYDDNDVKNGSFVELNYFGKELLQRANKPQSPNLLIATQTVQSLTKVEAFALSYDDLDVIF